jgi:transcriptional regulator with XRE-family HTH domain
MSAKSPDAVDVQVGQRIRVLRQEMRMSQTQLAEHLGVTFQQVQKYEKGMNRVGAGRLTKVAGVLGVSVTKLFGQDEDKDVTRSGPNGSRSPLGLLTVPGALRLLRAYGQIKEGDQRRAVVTLIESITR